MTRIGIEIREKEMRAVCLEGDNSVADVAIRKFNAGDDPLQQIATFVDNLRKQPGNELFVGLAIPGLVNQESVEVTYSDTVAELAGIDLRLGLEKLISGNIILENDANAAAYGEFRLGAGSGSSNMFYVMLDQGVGSGLIVDGKLWYGDNGFAGELGAMIVDSNDKRLRDLVSSGSVVSRTLARLHQDPTSILHSDDELIESRITISDIVKAANEDDGFAQMMLERTGGYAGTALASVIDLLNVGMIVIGGEVLDNHGFVVNSIRKRASELAYSASFEKTTFVKGKLGEEAPAIGVALLASEYGS